MYTVIEPPYDSNECRIAARHGLSYHVLGGSLVTHDGEDTSREATEAEIAMWDVLSGGLVGTLPATLAEILHSWEYRKGPWTINPLDSEEVLKLGQDLLDRNTHRELLDCGYWSWWHSGGWWILTSKHIPVGHFYAGERIEALYKPELELSFDEHCQVMENLHPFSL
jgi:hypothetical protein